MRAYQTLDQKIRKIVATGLVLATISVPAYSAGLNYDNTKKDNPVPIVTSGSLGQRMNPNGTTTAGTISGGKIYYTDGTSAPILFPDNPQPKTLDQYKPTYTSQIDEQIRRDPTNLDIYINLGLNEDDLSKKIRIYQEAERQIDKKNIRGPPEKIEKILGYLASTYKKLGEVNSASETYLKLHGLFPDNGHDFAAQKVLRKK